jgi:hypothetical protein
LSDVYLVSCVSVKGPKPTKARELYRSDWFRKARAYVEARGASWFVLSAKHGLVDPDQVVSPYNETLSGKPKRERKLWAAGVAAELGRRIEGPARIIILAGAFYRDELVPLLLDRFEVLAPLAHLGLGEQKRLLKLMNAGTIVVREDQKGSR